jgi:AcrR family transcriptional regulator
LLAVASDLFYRCGVRAVSVDEIVKAAGVVKPTFYRGYPSKGWPRVASVQNTICLCY